MTLFLVGLPCLYFAIISYSNPAQYHLPLLRLSKIYRETGIYFWYTLLLPDYIAELQSLKSTRLFLPGLPYDNFKAQKLQPE